uniref:ABC transmembrane type-1 domain-containing protein n=1 Tax=Mesocestoides corti TaxID=53468 RepID=A0A5K3ESY0_MESCO
MFKDGAGMVGRILFAAWGGSSLDSQCKQWRIFADVLNDLSLLLELLSVRIYYLFTPVVCFASVMRALVGMVGGATRAAITQHQALANNMADVAAKDGSQETLSNLVALAVNFLLITIVTGKPVLIWLVFALLTPLHLYANWRAVRCLQFDTLNRARFRILIEDWLRKHDEMSDRLPPLLSVREVNHREPIVYPSWGDSRGRTIHLGCSFETLTQMKDCKLQPLMGVYAKEKYILYSPEWKYSGYREYHLPIYICLHTDADTMDIFKALFHAEIVCALCYEGADCESFKQFWVGDDGIAFFAWTLGRATFWMTRILKSFSEHNSRRGEAQWSLSSLQVDAKPWRIHRNLYRVAAPEEVSTSKKCA